ncbi:hypothetical protein HRI_004737300 [Hibiscus trionum]|uniref:Retrotransposon gag domain-containing protein n=1 Tax=Hibiscus trionum TaxID=183268 RepID=A0A9W7J9Z4_HIBTR|nr:hypothetical protein HRI_004737300 [Hibiscus trionum]
MVRPRGRPIMDNPRVELIENVEHVRGENLPHPPPHPLERGANAEGVGPLAGQGHVGIDVNPLIQAIAGAIQTALAGVRVAALPQGAGSGLPLERLRSLGGVEFCGLSPEGSEAWFESTVRILSQMKCSEAHKLGCIVSLLKGDAYTWWTTITTGMPEAEVTWEFFRNAFRKKYLGPRYLDEKKREFMALVQGSLTMSDYEVQFVRLSQYASELVRTEKECCERFRYGLVQDVKIYMLASDYADFDVLVARAKDIEQSLGLADRKGGSSSGKRTAEWDRDRSKRHKDRKPHHDHRRGGGNPG